jgi:hypothetical protein
MNTKKKVRENRLRRIADRQGLKLSKSRRRDPRAVDYGGYMLTDQRSGMVVYGSSSGFAYQADLDDIENYLEGNG